MTITDFARPTHTPISPDRLLAAALRIALDPTIDEAQAALDMVVFAAGQATSLESAIAELDRSMSGGSCVARARRLLLQALGMEHQRGADYDDMATRVCP